MTSTNPATDNETTTNPTVAPQTGPHATVSTVEVTYEFEVMFAFDQHWTKTKALTWDGQPFTSPEDAWAWWHRLASSDSLYADAQAHLVETTRRVLGPAAEPATGWPTYHRHMALVAADRAARA